MDGSRWNGSSQPAVLARVAQSFCLDAVGPFVVSAKTSFASSIRHCCGSCAAAIAASADPLPYGLGSPDPRSLWPPPGVAGDATDAAEAGFASSVRVVGADANPSWSRVGRGLVDGTKPACEASARLNGMLRRRIRFDRLTNRIANDRRRRGGCGVHGSVHRPAPPVRPRRVFSDLASGPLFGTD